MMSEEKKIRRRKSVSYSVESEASNEALFLPLQ